MSPQPEQMHYVGVCRVCRTGPLGLRRCGGCGQILVLCDECDSVWIDADLDQPPCPAHEDDLPCPHCGESLFDAPSRWATLDEALACDWIREAVEQRRVELNQGAPFVPRRNVRPLDGEDETPDDG